MGSPLVSIIIPVFNGANFLREAIESALAQTYRPFEIIVVNDGSRDEGKTRDVALQFEPHIRYVEKENGGVATALNEGIRASNGEFISWLSHDDLYVPDKLEKQVEFIFSKNLTNTIVFSDEEWINTQGKPLGRTSHVSYPPEEFLFYLIRDCFLHGCSLLIPRNAFQACGTFNPALKTVQDYEMWLRMAHAGFSFAYLPVITGKSRVHPGQDSHTKQHIHKREKSRLFSWALDTFSPAALWGEGKNNSQKYFLFASSFFLRKLPIVGRKALELSLRGQSPAQRIKFRSMITGERIMASLRRAIYRLS